LKAGYADFFDNCPGAIATGSPIVFVSESEQKYCVSFKKLIKTCFVYVKNSQKNRLKPR
jgi:hypothetical protein